MITQEFLSQCSDEQINKGVAWLRFCGVVEDGDNWKDYIDLSEIPEKPNWPKYCSNPNDIMPIAFANEISIEKEEGEEEWCAMFGVRYADSYYYPVQSCDIFSTNTNPLRAICEVYILMSVNK